MTTDRDDGTGGTEPTSVAATQVAAPPHVSARRFLGAELRRWRERRHLSAMALAGQVYASRELLSKIENGHRRASVELIRRCDEVLDTDGILERVLGLVHAIESAPQPALARAPDHITVRITAELVSSGPTGQPAVPWAVDPVGARIYSFPVAGRQSRPSLA